MEEEPARELGWKYPKDQTFLLVLLQSSSSEEHLAMHKGAAPSPVTPLPLLLLLKLHFSGTVPTDCHLYLFLLPLTQVPVVEEDAP